MGHQHNPPAESYTVTSAKHSNLEETVTYTPRKTFVDGDKIAAEDRAAGKICLWGGDDQKCTHCFRCGEAREGHLEDRVCACRFCEGRAVEGHPDTECPWLYGTVLFWEERLGLSKKGAVHDLPRVCRIKPSPDQVKGLLSRGETFFKDFPYPRPGIQPQLLEGYVEIIPSWAKETHVRLAPPPAPARLPAPSPPPAPPRSPSPLPAPSPQQDLSGDDYYPEHDDNDYSDMHMDEESLAASQGSRDSRDEEMEELREELKATRETCDNMYHELQWLRSKAHQLEQTTNVSSAHRDGMLGDVRLVDDLERYAFVDVRWNSQ